MQQQLCEIILTKNKGRDSKSFSLSSLKRPNDTRKVYNCDYWSDFTVA